MQCDLSRRELYELVKKQLNNFFPEFKYEEEEVLINSIDRALEKCETCFGNIENKYFYNIDVVKFNYMHSGQYTNFLYYISNSEYYIYKNIEVAEKVYYLNKIMNSIEVFYEVSLPRCFYVEHPIGTVLGRAEYGENFTVYQNCTVGNSSGKCPIIGADVTMYANSCILGGSIIGKNSIISANTYIINEEIPINSIVFGSSPNLVIKKNTKVNKLFKRVMLNS